MIASFTLPTVHARQCRLRYRRGVFDQTYLETADVNHVYFACCPIIAAFIFDILDGRIARWRQNSRRWVATRFAGG
jgi:phosphatidylglycerophosphate synthase